MPTTAEELDRFTNYVKQRLANGGADLSLDELFDLWRIENPSDEQYAESVVAIDLAIQDFRHGDRGTPAGEHSDRLRRDLGMEGDLPPSRSYEDWQRRMRKFIADQPSTNPGFDDSRESMYSDRL